jgi:hypothetical protein
MQCDNAQIVDVRDNGMVIGQDIICSKKKGKILGGFRAAQGGFYMPDCYRLCWDRVVNKKFVNRE